MLEQESPGGSTGGTPHRKLMKKKKLPEPTKDLATKDLTQGYCVLLELLKGHKTFFYPPDSSAKNMVDYYEVVKEPMWLDEMRRRFESGEYQELKQFAADMRLLLKNCYRFFGANNLATKRALKLECSYIQCVLLLPQELQSQCSLLPDDEVIEVEDGGSEGFRSQLLERVLDDQRRKEEERQRHVAEQVSLAEENKDVIRWEREVLVSEAHERQIKGMWELPLIGQFVYLALDALNVDEISMYEVERMLLMPQASHALARLVTSLLISPKLRQAMLHLPPMSYHMWSRRLALRVSSWYRTHAKNNCNTLRTFEMIGVETEFWKVLGETNLLEKCTFHELSFHQRVWVLKSLCDYCLHNQLTLHSKISTPENRDAFKHNLGRDRSDFRYDHLPELCGDDLRVYRQAPNCMSLIERDEMYREQLASQAACQTDATKDCTAADTCSDKRGSRKRRKERVKSSESDSGLSCDSSDTRPCDDSSNEQSRAGSSLIQARFDYVKEHGHIYDPHWLSPENSGFEVVVDSYQALNELISRLSGETSDQNLCNAKTPKKKLPKCEAELVQELQILASNLKEFEAEFIACMKRAREKMYKEWQEYQTRPDDFVDPSDAIWTLSSDQHDVVDEKVDDKIQNSISQLDSAVKENHHEEIPEHKSEELDGRERYSRRARRKVDFANAQMQGVLNDDLQLDLLVSDIDDYEEEAEGEEEGDDDDDDVWEMPGKKKKVTNPKPRGRKRKLSLPDAVLPDGSVVTPKPKKSGAKKIANTSNSKAGPVRKNASRKLFCNENSDVSVPPVQDSALHRTGDENVCEQVLSVKKEEDALPSTEPAGQVAGCVQVRTDLGVKQEIKEEPGATVKQETEPVADDSVLSAPTQNVDFQLNSMPLFVYQPQQINALAGASSVIVTPIVASMPFSSSNCVGVSPASQVQAPMMVSQISMGVPTSQDSMAAPTSQVSMMAAPSSQVSMAISSPQTSLAMPMTHNSGAEAPVRQTVLHRVGGPSPVISSEVICLDSDSSDSDVELVEDIKVEPKAAVPKPATPITPGRISFVPEHILKNEVTPPKNIHPLSTLKKALDKRLNVAISGEAPKEVNQRLPITMQHQYQNMVTTPPTQTLPVRTFNARNSTPTRSPNSSTFLQSSPNTPTQQQGSGRGTDIFSSFLSTPKKQPAAYPTTPRNTLPPTFSNSPRTETPAYYNSPRGMSASFTNSPRGVSPSFTNSQRAGAPATFSPSAAQWNSPQGQYSPRPVTRGRGSYAARQRTPIRGQSVAGRGRASPAASSPRQTARLFQQDNGSSTPGSLPIVGDVDHTTGSFRYALVMSNGSKIPLTPEQVDQIRKGNGGMLPSSL
ncbi:uncharacterized protein LOC134534880 [Bacillus rossius redtenbacheri]|uniref:uncharacterized protein LOC134534880 n=1 Tax=Bacillus rossius redtenbacheri TaxID=93214 RepID=UPI002FDD7178